MDIPGQLKSVASDVLAGTARRAKVSTLMGWYRLQRRRAAGIARVKADLETLGIDTFPPFDSADWEATVRFVPRSEPVVGDDPVEGADEPEDFALYRESQRNGRPLFRALLRTWESYDRLLRRVILTGDAIVVSHGQNARRQDRDRLPFYLLLEATGDQAPDVETWIREALVPGEPGIDEGPVGTAPVPTVVVPDVDQAIAKGLHSLGQRIADMHEAGKADLEERIHTLWTSVERKVDELRFDTVQRIAQELNNDEALQMLEEFQADWRARNEEKVREIQDLSVERNLLESRIYELEEQITQSSEYDPSEAFPTLQSTVQLFREIAADSPVFVHENAERSAIRSACTRRREVLRLLLTLADLADGRFVRGEIGISNRDWFRDRGYEYASGDAQTTATRYGEERRITLDGRSVQLEDHVTLFPNTNDCVTVYFLFDQAPRRLVIGYVGPHLRTASW
jgi:hypothetical protein